MKIILLKNIDDAESIDVVKEGDRNLVFESYQELDDWCIEHGLEDDSNYVPFIVNKSSLRLDRILAGAIERMGTGMDSGEEGGPVDDEK